MRWRRATSLAMAIVFVAACGASPAPTPVTPTQPPTGVSPVVPPVASLLPATATELQLAADFRFTGPWAVKFSLPGRPTQSEVYVATPTCGTGACTTNVVVQGFDGEELRTGVFEFRDGRYTYEHTQTTTSTCIGGGKQTVTTTTSLRLVAFRPLGVAASVPRILGERTIARVPAAGSNCAASSSTYVATGSPTRFAPTATPTPTPRPTPTPSRAKDPIYGGSFFGSNVRVNAYTVTGATPSAILASIRARGPWSEWLRSRGEAVTRIVIAYRFRLAYDAIGSCHIAATANPIVKPSFTITLPKWTRPRGVSDFTVQWWTRELNEVAVHERTHVRIARDGVARMNKTIASSTCANVRSRIQRIAQDIQRQECEFDMREYGEALGLSLNACVAA